LNLAASPPDQEGTAGEIAAVAKRFIVRSLAFIGLIVPSFLLLALLAAPARPQPLEPAGCARTLADSNASMAAMQTHLAGLHGSEACAATRLLFLELVKARAVIALCKNGPERERDLGRVDADVERINKAIATTCS
jgi:hypothetical protein